MRVRSGETPRSPVAKPPCVVERPGAERGRATDQSATSSEACSAVTPVRALHGRGGAEPFPYGRRPWTAPEILERVPYFTTQNPYAAAIQLTPIIWAPPCTPTTAPNVPIRMASRGKLGAMRSRNSSMSGAPQCITATCSIGPAALMRS